MQFVTPQLFQEAIDKIGARSPIGSKLNSEQWGNVPTALRERAFFSSTIENTRFLQRGRDAITDFLSGAREVLPSGETALAAGSRQQFVKLLQEFALKEGMGPLDPEDAGGLKDITSERRLGLIFDTNTRAAQDFGYWKQGQDPDVLDEFPAQRFIRTTDVEDPRAWHQRFEGEVHLKSDLDFWTALNEDFGVPWGPWGWGCGHDVEDVDRDEAEQLGLIQRGEKAQPVEKDFNDRLEAGVKNLDADMRALLKESFGDQIDIEGDSVVWRKSEVGMQKAEVAAVVPPIDQGSTESHPTKPVSAALAIDPTLAAAKKKSIANALRVIDSVHDDGVLPRITVDRSTRRDFVAAYAYDGRTGRAAMIMVSNLRDVGEHVLTHELGHFLDHQALGVAGQHASISSPVLDAWRAAVMNSDAVKALQANLASGLDTYRVRYLLKPQELFARSYAQWITQQSQDPKLLKQLPKVKLHLGLNSQWSDEDFAPIAAAFEEIFKQKGWL